MPPELGALLEAALTYAGRGLQVIPLHSRGADGCSCGDANCLSPAKHPRTVHGLKDATNDESVVMSWWSRWPDANVGVVTGTASGVVVLDVDTQHGGLRTLRELEAKHGKLPAVPQVLTGGGGAHYYFRSPGGEIRNSAGRLGHGLDVRGDGGYVVAPPSIHATGRSYKWTKLGPGVELVAPPSWLLEDAERRRNGPAPVVEEKIPHGRQHDTLVSIAGTMRRRGLGEEEIFAALWTANQNRCERPGPEAHIRQIARTVAAYPPGDAIYVEKSYSGIPTVTGFAGKNPPEGGELLFTPLTSLLENVPPDPPWVVGGYLAPGAITLLAGRPKVGKSTLGFALLADVARGDPFVGLPTSAGGVLMLTEERQDTIAEKARATQLIRFRQPPGLKARNESEMVHALLRHDAGATPWPEIVRQAMAYCAQHKLIVLVVDTFDRWSGLRGESENAAGSVNAALEPLQYAAAAGLAVLLISHQRKSSGEFGEAVRGSNALTGGVDVVLELERPARTLQLGSQARVLRAVSRFTSTPEELYIELGEHGFAPIESPEQVKTDAERARLLEALEERGEAVTSDQLGDELELPKRAVRRYLNDLLEQELVTRDGAGKKSEPYVWRSAQSEEAA